MKSQPLHRFIVRVQELNVKGIEISSQMLCELVVIIIYLSACQKTPYNLTNKHELSSIMWPRFVGK